MSLNSDIPMFLRRHLRSAPGAVSPAGTKLWAGAPEPRYASVRLGAPQVMNGTLDFLEARFGGVLPYLASIGFGPADVARLEAVLVDPAAAL